MLPLSRNLTKLLEEGFDFHKFLGILNIILVTGIEAMEPLADLAA